MENLYVKFAKNLLENTTIMEEKCVQVVELFFEELFKIDTTKYLCAPQNLKTVLSICKPEKAVNTAGFKNVLMLE